MKTTEKKNARSKRNDFKIRQLSRQQINRQIIGRQFHLKQNISRLKKKAGLGQIQTQDLLANLAGNA